MDTPTRGNVSIHLPDGPLHIMRGYETINRSKGTFEFIGAHDGPLIQLLGPQARLVTTVEFVPQIIEALQAAIIPPTAASGTYDNEIRAMGLEMGDQDRRRDIQHTLEPGK